MVRPTSATLEAQKRFPHMRGDGPAMIDGQDENSLFSPHAWGWSGVGSR